MKGIKITVANNDEYAGQMACAIWRGYQIRGIIQEGQTEDHFGIWLGTGINAEMALVKTALVIE